MNKIQEVRYRCAACEAEVCADDTVWVDPNTGEATTGDAGKPYHVDCAPSEHDADDDTANAKDQHHE